MAGTILIGRGDTIHEIPQSDWENELRGAPEAIARRLDFMTPDHHRIRNHVVRELPRLGRPITLAEISEALELAPRRTKSLVEELERNLFFLVRGDGSAHERSVNATTRSRSGRCITIPIAASARPRYMTEAIPTAPGG